jgi:hypothetical protein
MWSGSTAVLPQYECARSGCHRHGEGVGAWEASHGGRGGSGGHTADSRGCRGHTTQPLARAARAVGLKVAGRRRASSLFSFDAVPVQVGNGGRGAGHIPSSAAGASGVVFAVAAAHLPHPAHARDLNLFGFNDVWLMGHWRSWDWRH